MSELFGQCSFCGQSRIIRVSGEMDQEEANRLVSESCECDGALLARSEAEIMDRIDQLFGPACGQKGFDVQVDMSTRFALRTVALDVLTEKFEEAKIKLPGGDMATFKSVGNVNIEIIREMKRKRTV